MCRLCHHVHRNVVSVSRNRSTCAHVKETPFEVEDSLLMCYLQTLTGVTAVAVPSVSCTMQLHMSASVLTMYRSSQAVTRNVDCRVRLRYFFLLQQTSIILKVATTLICSF